LSEKSTIEAAVSLQVLINKSNTRKEQRKLNPLKIDQSVSTEAKVNGYFCNWKLQTSFIFVQSKREV
jgi:hypothetical protein